MNATRNNRGRRLATTAVVLILIAVVFGLRFRSLGHDEAVAGVRQIQETEGIPVEIVDVETGDLAKWMTLAGTVEGRVQYPVVSNNALQVLEIPVAEGDSVRAGDVIIRLAEGAPSPMVHSLEKSRAQYENARINVARLRNLHAEGAVSQADLDAAETTLKVLAADLEDAENSKALTAAEDGVVSSLLVEVGDTVKAGSPLVWITDTSDVKIKFSAGSRQALRLRAGQLAAWTAPDGSPRTGSVTLLDKMADPKSHLLEGEAVFDNADGLLIPGLLISFDVRTDVRRNTLVLPAACLVDDNGADAVWVAGSTAALVDVEVGLRLDDRVEILDGLRPGQSIVRHGQTLLSDGVKIKAIAAGEER